MGDHELLELAAKAAGLDSGRGTTLWNPLVDDGDAFRLAVFLKMDLTFENGMVNALASHPVSYAICGASEMPGDDRAAATRRAIVRAAAACAAGSTGHR